jgi:16S rRNA (guanine966-N2)-methyltransferase
MALKILQGEAKGLSLVAPSSGTRPTSVLLRRKVFDAHQDMSDSIFIDCCAGTGAMGLEAS